MIKEYLNESSIYFIKQYGSQLDNKVFNLSYGEYLEVGNIYYITNKQFHWLIYVNKLLSDTSLEVFQKHSHLSEIETIKINYNGRLNHFININDYEIYKCRLSLLINKSNNTSVNYIKDKLVIILSNEFLIHKS